MRALAASPSRGAGAARAVAAALAANTTLEFLDLRSNLVGVGAGGAIAAALRSNGSVRHLNLQDNGLGVGASGAALLGVLRADARVRVSEQRQRQEKRGGRRGIPQGATKQPD